MYKKITALLLISAVFLCGCKSRQSVVCSYPQSSDILILVNRNNSIPEGYIDTVQLKSINERHKVDARCFEYLMNMLDDCRKAGFSPVICSSFRTNSYQKMLYEKSIEKYEAMGYSRQEAIIAAEQGTAIPGTSEHELGLAVDIVSTDNQRLDISQENTPTQQWLMANSWKYGFILRYPKGKTDITGIMYEPWHYRFVGVLPAKEIFGRQITLEEYLSADM